MERVLNYPKKSHRKQITIPKESSNLAELMGIVLGDGGINNQWQVVVTLNAVKDKSYANFVASLFTRLFDVNPVIRFHPKENVVRVVCSSMNVVDYMVSKGAVRGHKIRQQIRVPDWVKESLEYQKSFVRGLVDTDGCLYIHKHFVGKRTQNNIGFCFSSYSEKLLTGVADVLNKFDIVPHITNKKRSVYLYSAKAVKKYLEIFGTSNNRISSIYENWLEQKENIGEVA